MDSIVGNVYDDTGLARDPAAREDGPYDPLGCGGPWPWWCVLALNDHGEALLAPAVMGPLRQFYDRQAGAFRYRADVHVPGLGAAAECLVDGDTHRPVPVVTESGKRWHVLAGCGHWHPAPGLPGAAMDRVLPDHVRAAARATRATAWPPPEEEPAG